MRGTEAKSCILGSTPTWSMEPNPGSSDARSVLPRPTSVRGDLAATCLQNSALEFNAVSSAHPSLLGLHSLCRFPSVFHNEGETGSAKLKILAQEGMS